MSQPTQLTSENLQTVNDGSDRLTQQGPASVSARSSTTRERGNRFPVDVGEYGRAPREPRHRTRDSASSLGSSVPPEQPTERHPSADQGSVAPAIAHASSSGNTRGTPAIQEAEENPGGSSRKDTEPKGKARATPKTPVYDLGLDAAQEELLAELVEINGQDSYDALAAGIGKLKKDEYLRLPADFPGLNVAPRDVGKPVAHAHTGPANWAQVYVLNKAVTPEGADPVVFGFLRMEAVKAGWYTNQREVTFVPAVRDAVRVMITDFATIRDRVERLKTAAFIVPLVAEHVFRTMGHHYITSDSATYTSRYADTFKSCLLPDIAGILPPAVLYHTALHWVSPARSRAVLIAQMGTPSVPDALTIRANAAPAGTAILTTTAAIIESMTSVGLAAQFEEFGGFNLQMITALTAVVKSDPTRYHKSYFAYGVNALDAGETARLEEAKAEAIRFAPYAQAFIQTLLREAALGRARALLKHAEGNPVQMRRAGNFFRALVRKEVTSVAKLFEASITARDVD